LNIFPGSSALSTDNADNADNAGNADNADNAGNAGSGEAALQDSLGVCRT
jgi:hypothetical protein